MKITYFGTAAAEGVPALFCKCDVCKKARRLGGRDIRSRSQSLIDDCLLIDFSGDSYLHFIKYAYDLSDIENLVVTHSHGDHFYPEDLAMRMKGYSNNIDTKLTVYGNEKVGTFFERALALEGFRDDDRLAFQQIVPYEKLSIDRYEIIPLLADHDKREECLIYQLTDGEKTMLYAHDTGYILEKNWQYWKETKPYFHYISLDCTHQKHRVTGNHMSFYDNLAVKDRMFKEGIADEATCFVLSHFSHNGGMNYEEMVNWSEKEGFIVAYDGLEQHF